MNRANLVRRLVFAAWAIPLGWWVVNSNLPLLPKGALGSPDVQLYPANIVAIGLTVLACYEYIRMLSFSFPRNGFWLAYVWLGLQFISFFTKLDLHMQLDTYVLLLLVAAEAILWGRKAQSGRWRRASLFFSGTLFLWIAGQSMLYVYLPPFQTVFPSRYSHPLVAQLGVVAVVASIFLCDSAAFFVGSFFGKTRLSNISPKKTVEGSIAGLFAAVIMSSLGWYFFAPREQIARYSPVLGIAIGLLVGVFAQLGDLIVSLIKRSFRVKDASNMIPGHGGILDRFDSVFFTLPVLNLFFLILSRIVH